MALAPDADWSRAIVWSPDSRKVGFVINDQRLAVYDTRSFELEAMLLLVSDGSNEVRSVALGNTGSVSFDLVERAVMNVPIKDGQRMQVGAVRIGQYRPGSHVVRPERMLGRRTLAGPGPRLSLRLGHLMASRWPRMGGHVCRSGMAVTCGRRGPGVAMRSCGFLRSILARLPSSR
ncbi:hypothetical protein LuPra_00068 [Luteitalea pratensis]|uniref:Uncharacterized protein n=1 Tax=Luteitalea pratensis TaxID=1855912 RepID=A0A143PEM7_LUTPR|nr:hypothetical protein [Luteitalea pratensis]AMY06906.1 hypothetical protein LuPra_00068 [Luteitalea pratensis]